MLSADRLHELELLEGGHFWVEGRDRLTDRLISRFSMQPPFIVLGSGTGRYAQRLLSRGHTTWLDLGPVRPGGVRADATALPFRDASVGTVLARDVLEHLDDRTAIAEAARVLRPGGHLLVTVPAWPSLWSERDDRAGHLRRYRRRTLLDVIGPGFDVLDLRGFQFALLPLVAASRLLPGDPTARERATHPALDRLLTAVNLAEVSLASFGGPKPPTGSSLALVARRT